MQWSSAEGKEGFDRSWFSYTDRAPTRTHRITPPEYSVSKLMRISWNIQWSLHPLMRDTKMHFTEIIYFWKADSPLLVLWHSAWGILWDVRACDGGSLLQMLEQNPREMRDLIPCSEAQHTSLQRGGNLNAAFDLFWYRAVNDMGPLEHSLWTSDEKCANTVSNPALHISYRDTGL